MQKGSVNKVVLVGNVGGDPDTRFTPSGTAVSNFSIATSESWKESDGGFKDKTEWHRCVIWGKPAEVAGNIMKKGQLVYIEGRLQTRKWEDKEGVERKTTEIICDMFTILSRKMQTGDSGEMRWDNKDSSNDNNNIFDDDDSQEPSEPNNEKDDDSQEPSEPNNEKDDDSQEPSEPNKDEEEDDLPF